MKSTYTRQRVYCRGFGRSGITILMQKFSELLADIDREQPQKEHASAPNRASGDTITTTEESKGNSATTGASTDAEVMAIAVRITGDSTTDAADSEHAHIAAATDDGAADTPHGGNSGANESSSVAATGTNDKPSKHSIARKMQRAIELAAAGQVDQANAIAHSLTRATARKSARSTGGAPRPKYYFLLPEWREQWSGQDIREICQTLGKTVYKRDTSGAEGREYWRACVAEILATEQDPRRVPDKVADAIEAKLAARNTADRTTLTNGLVEIMVQAAELAEEDPRQWVRPIKVHANECADDSATASAEDCASG